jgi:serine protease
MSRRGLFLSVIVFPIVALFGCGGSNGSDGEKNGGGQQGQEYTVTVSVTGQGSANPEQKRARAGEQASIELIPADGFRVVTATGCAGSREENLYTTGALEGDCTVEVEFIPSGGVSGTLMPAHGSVVDLTINDAQAPLGTNTSCEQAQLIENRDTVHGFSSATGTGGDPSEEHFADTDNTSDFYRVSLSFGQVIQLDVADYQEDDNELSLYLWSDDCSRQIASSSGGGEKEQVDVPLGGERVIEVRSQAGTSKYVLRLRSAWESSDEQGTDDDERAESYAARMPEFIAGEFIITFEQGVDAGVHDTLSEALYLAKGHQLDFVHDDVDRATLARLEDTGTTSPTAVISGVLDNLKERNETAYQTLKTLKIAEFLAQQPGVEFAEPNYILRHQRTPNDPQYPQQWHYEQIDLPEAWQVTRGARDDGEDVIVAVLDTGVFLDHEDLRDKLVPGYDFHDGNSDPDETNNSNNWHGTHVAGTVAASTDNHIGVAGVSWKAKIMPLRVLGEEGGSRYNVIQGVRFAAGLTNDSGTVPERRADVINMSLGGGSHSGAEQNLYQRVRGEGVIVVAAAGNDDTDQPMYPAAYEGVLSVGATDCRDERAGYSNYGPTISLSAPGGGANCGLSNGQILSTIGSGSGESRTSAYGRLQGTSMAAPHVAGVMALMRAVYPDLTPNQVDALLENGELTDDLGHENFGHGRINAAKAVQAAQSAADGEVPTRITARPSVLYLGHDSEANLELVQENEGNPPRRTGIESEEWLSVAEEDVDDQGLGQYRVTVDRSMFDEDDFGQHSGELLFRFDDETEVTVQVHIQVGFATETAPIYVLLLDAETNEPVHQVLARWNGEGELRYQFEGVAPGDYLLIAGSDIDADGQVCQVGEMCGAYPSFEARERVTVTGTELEELDMSLDILTQFRPFDVEPVMRLH